MKLRNKRTGEIGYTAVLQSKAIVVMDENAIQLGSYTSLAELNDEWEDYKEPKEHWCITMYGGITRIRDDEEPINDLIEIGNYFNSKEDAYDALDNLKVWKKLKNTITCIDIASFNDTGTATIFIRYDKENHKKVKECLDFFFRGEE